MMASVSTTEERCNQTIPKGKRKEQLEEARKVGRYIMVAAAMRGKSRVVKLPISSEKLA